VNREGEMADEAQQAQETKEQKFTRLATKRTQAALTKIRLLGNLTGSSYRYTEDQASKIIGTLRQAIDEIEGKFKKVRGQKVGDQPFSL
jgi:hypothetical protein